MKTNKNIIMINTCYKFKINSNKKRKMMIRKKTKKKKKNQVSVLEMSQKDFL